MGVKIRKRGGKWYVYVNYRGRRKAKCVGSSRDVAEKVRRELEARLALGDLGVFSDGKSQAPTFDAYADHWLEDHARMECKTSTADGYEGVLRLYLRPRFGKRRLDEVKRDDIKAMVSDLIALDLSRNTIRNAVCVIRGMFNQAIEAGILESNPAARLGRFTRTARVAETKGTALSAKEAHEFLEAAKIVCPEYYPLFLTALRAGLRRGELVALQWGDIQFGRDDDDPNRFIVVQHNYVRREYTTTKSKKSRRVDLSRDLRTSLLEVRDKRLLEAFLKDQQDISDDLVFPSPDGAILDPDNLYHRYFQPVLTKAGLRKIRLHDLRHTFGSLLIQNGASIVYVKEQLGHSSIQVTVDIYGHLIPGANVSFVDSLDRIPEESAKTTQQQNATQAQQPENCKSEIRAEVTDLIGGGAWTRTTDLRIMSATINGI
jgi:integrase